MTPYKCCLLFLIVSLVVPLSSSSMSLQSAVYVDTTEGVLESSCWTGGENQPCRSLEFAVEGAQKLNSAVVIVKPDQYDIPHSEERYHSSTDSEFNPTDTESDNLTTCPSWYFYNSTRDVCECGSDADGIVHCSPQNTNVSLLNCYCMTYDNATGKTVVGACVYNWFRNSIKSSSYHPLPSDVLNLNEEVCGRFNRQGQLCGSCKEGYHQLVYSYDLHCVECSYTRYSWAKYVFAAFGPLTLFFVIVNVLRFSTTAPPLRVLVFICQFLSAPQIVRLFLASIHVQTMAPLSTAVRVMASLYGIWNLDFFRTLLPPICLPLTTLQARALDYAIAFYPLLLIVVAYVLIELHARGCELIVWLCTPFNNSFLCCRRWFAEYSIVDAFCTFISLSYVKFLSVSLDILVPVRLFDIHGKGLDTLYLYSDATVEYFGKEHLPYAILALFVLFFMVILPQLSLVLSSCKWFHHSCLARLGHRRFHAVHIFTESILGHLKDGTDGTRDYRWFASVCIGTQAFILILYAIVPNVYVWPLMATTLVVLITLMNIIQPYKLPTNNQSAVTLAIVTALWCYSIQGINTASTGAPQLLYFSYVLTTVLYSLPLCYCVALLLWWIVQKRKLPQEIVNRLRARHSNTVDEDFEQLLPDRLVNPARYVPREDLEGNTLNEHDEHNAPTYGYGATS